MADSTSPADLPVPDRDEARFVIHPDLRSAFDLWLYRCDAVLVPTPSPDRPTFTVMPRARVVETMPDPSPSQGETPWSRDRNLPILTFLDDRCTRCTHTRAAHLFGDHEYLCSVVWCECVTRPALSRRP